MFPRYFLRSGVYFTGTLGPAYNEFGYNENPAIANNFSPQKKSLLIDINVKKVYLQPVPFITNKFFWIRLLVVNGSQYTIQTEFSHLRNYLKHF